MMPFKNRNAGLRPSDPAFRTRPLIKRQWNGRVGNDGNGMVGGKWWSCTRLAYHDISLDDVMPEECPDNAKDWLTEKMGDSIRVEAYITEGADESVGLSYNVDLDESFPPDIKVYEAIYDCPYLTKKQQEEVSDRIDRIMDELDENCDYEFYEINYTEKED